MAAGDGASEAELLDIAVEAARAAGAELLARWRRPLEVDTKSTPTDPVTEADLNAERAIREVLARRRPQDSILGEEGGETPGAEPTIGTYEGESAGLGTSGGEPAGLVTSGGEPAGLVTSGGEPPIPPSSAHENDNDSDYHYRFGGGDEALRWVVDPLDGTVNFLYGLPTFAVSVAVEDGAGGIASVVLDPVSDELFSATRSGGPLANGQPIAASGCDSLDRALVGTGFGYQTAVRAAQAEVAARVIPLARDIRRAGAAALDMCWCASGRLDAYYERGVKAWDIAAGTLICERAGLVVRTLDPYGVLPSGVVVAPREFIDELTELMT